MFDLRNKNIHVGTQKVLKGYLGTNLLFNSAGLVFPEPPTEYYTSNLRNAYFFGGGVEHTYQGSSFTAEGDYSMEPNGLRLNGGRAYAYTTNRFNTDGIVEITIENNFDHLEPGDSQTILYLDNASRFGGGNLRVERKEDGVYLSMNNRSLLVPDTDFIHIHVRFGFRISGSYYYLETSVRVNGSLWESFQSYRTSSNSDMGYVYATGDILLYDLKYYSRDLSHSTVNSTNYNGIKDLPFVRTDQL